MSWICLMCDEICYDEVWPWGDSTLCNPCYHELMDIRIEEINENKVSSRRPGNGDLAEEE